MFVLWDDFPVRRRGRRKRSWTCSWATRATPPASPYDQDIDSDTYKIKLVKDNKTTDNPGDVYLPD